MWLEYPSDGAALTLDDQWMVGSELLVRPVTAEGGTSASVYFPAGAWYDAETLRAVRAPGSAAARVDVSAPLERIPVFQRGGAIVPRQMRPRRASAAQAADPYTLVVALDASHAAAGELYLDDGVSYDYAKRGLFRLRRFEYGPASSGGGSVHVLRSTLARGNKLYVPTNTVERVLVFGAGRSPREVSVTEGDSATAASRALTFTHDETSDVITIRKPDVKVAFNFQISITF
jgi:alpha 1,3-glucosidase